MSATSKRLALARFRDEVAARTEAGKPFDEVEDAIELADATEDQKAALWLMAYSIRDRRERRRAVAAGA
jgi:hypothetical protein